MNDQLDPNKRYESKSLGTWSSTSDVDTFLSKFNHDNMYMDDGTKLALGNYVTIQDGTYNKDWIIAGFDMEHSQTAADGTTYNNGYGICLIPKTYLYSVKWNTSGTTEGGYISSYIHKTSLPAVVTNLKDVLGNHIVNRNVLLSSSTDTTNYKANDYTWTTAHATIMPVGQMTGVFYSYGNKYDYGEARYKIPLFDYEDYWVSSRRIWTRCINSNIFVWNINTDGTINTNYSTSRPNTEYGLRPLIYIR